MGIIASILSIPLSLYIYNLQRQATDTKIKRDIVKTLLLEIANGTKISESDIKSIINAKLENVKFKSNITYSIINNELFLELLSNPFIDKDKKHEIWALLHNIPKYYNPNEINFKFKKVKISYLPIIMKIILVLVLISVSFILLDLLPSKMINIIKIAIGPISLIITSIIIFYIYKNYRQLHYIDESKFRNKLIAHQ